MPKKKRVKSSDRGPLNWLPKIPFLKNKYFLAMAGLVILANFSKGTNSFPYVVSSYRTDLTLYASL